MSTPIRFPSFAALAIVALACGGCVKKQEREEPAGNPGAASAAPARGGGTAEAMGFASASETEYFSSGAPTPASVEKTPEAASGPVVRTLTARDGRSVEATLLSRTDEAVKIRRKADGAEFTVPFERLSDADRRFIERSALPKERGG